MCHSRVACTFFFFNDTATTEIYTLSLHDALPILEGRMISGQHGQAVFFRAEREFEVPPHSHGAQWGIVVTGRLRSEEHTSELQSRQYLVCRLLLEKKKKIYSCASTTKFNEIAI